MPRDVHLTSLTPLKPMSDINLTPLMDLSFLLLITFIITFPLIEQGIQIDLPEATAKELSPETSKTITLDQQGEVYLDNAKISMESLRDRLEEMGRSAPDVAVMVRADERIVYGRVIDVLRIIHHAGIVKMSLVTEEEAERQL